MSSFPSTIIANNNTNRNHHATTTKKTTATTTTTTMTKRNVRLVTTITTLLVSAKNRRLRVVYCAGIVALAILAWIPQRLKVVITTNTNTDHYVNVGTSSSSSSSIMNNDPNISYNMMMSQKNATNSNELPIDPSSSGQQQDQQDQQQQQDQLLLLLRWHQNCTSEQLRLIRKQLPGTECQYKQTPRRTRRGPWLQRCSFTKATGCVDPSWLREHYAYDYNNNDDDEQLILLKNDNDFNDDTSRSSSSSSTNTDMVWIGMNIGCNKGFDAINIARMLSNDDGTNYGRILWKQYMEHMGTQTEIGCELKSQEYQPIQQVTVTTSSSDKYTHNENRRRPSTTSVFCVEPMPLTVDALRYSAKSLNYPSWVLLGGGNDSSNSSSSSTLFSDDDPPNGPNNHHPYPSHRHYFTVTKAAIGRYSNASGVLFPASKKDSNQSHLQIDIGTENVGLNSKNCNAEPNTCEAVPLLSLDDYMDQYVLSSSQRQQLVNKDYVIKILSIDVEGYDYDVVLGGSNTLKHVEYIDIEYNWFGSWEKQSLYEFISNMQDNYNFICYWAGWQHLWRITGCFLPYYEYHTWSNIACVNPMLNPKLAIRMEAIFLKTIQLNITFA